MAYSEGQLNGAQDYRVGIDVWYSGVQDWNANTSRFDWNVRIVGTYGSWTNATSSWSASIGGTPYSGTFTLPSGWGSPRIVASGSTWHEHDANGYRPGFASSAYISVPHSNIGSGGSGNAWVDAPRIPQLPPAPTSIGLDQLQPTSMRYRFSGNGDGGSAILEWQAQLATNSAFTTGLQTVASSGTTTFTGLTPATTYYARSRGRNARGWGGWSNTVSAMTASGAYVSVGGKWQPVPILYSNGTTWLNPELWASDGTDWERPL